MRATPSPTRSASASPRSRWLAAAQLTREEILTTAGVTGRTSLLFLDATAARARLKANPWIAEATVLKLYPGRLHIKVTERDAFALWQKDGKVAVISADGTVVESFVSQRFAKLPMVVGAGADIKAREFLAIIDGFPAIRDQLRASILVADRRWNLRLKNGIEHPSAGGGHRDRADDAGRARPRQEAAQPRHRHGRSALAGSRHRASVGRRLQRARRGAQAEAQAQGRRRMSLRDGFSPKMKPVSPRRSAIVAVLDIGTSKIVCLIARLKPQSPQETLRRRTHGVEILGIGHTEARGIKGGAVINLAEAEAAVRHAVDLAERAASVQLESVVVSVSAGRIGSELYTATVNVAGSAITEGDVASVLTAGSYHSVRDGRLVLHSLPIGYSLDGVRGISEPRGMLAREFGVDMHAVTCDIAAARNLMLTVERCHLAVETMVAAPYVAGLSAMADDEADLGAAVVDMGAGTTTTAVFSSGRFIHADSFALGGQHVTMDLARGLNTPIADAERIKTLHGSVIGGSSDERDMISVPRVGDDEREPPQFVSRASLVRIIKPRVEEILEMVRDRLANSPFAAEPRSRVIFTGGASQLTGLAGACRQHPQSPGPHRPAARHLRAARGRQGAGLRRGGGASGLSAGGASRTFRTAANAASHDRDGIHRPCRTMAPGELLMIDATTTIYPRISPIGRRRSGAKPAASLDAAQ